MYRKLTYLLVCSVVITGSVSGAFAQPADGQIRQAWHAPTIDGKIDQIWYGTFVYSLDVWLTASTATVQDHLDISATWRALWDSNRLYILVDVNDADLVYDSPGSGPWFNMNQDDGIEVYIDADNSKGTTYAADDFQYGFRWNDPGSIGTGSNSNTNISGVEFVIAEKTEPRGYICEISIPWLTLGTTPGLGDFIGFNVGVNDDDNGGDLEAHVRWLVTSHDQWKNPSLFPTIELVGAAPRGMSTDPYPLDGATDVQLDVVLSWTPGFYAPAVDGHQVYFNENFSDVNDGIGGIIQDANSCIPPMALEYGQTYYWRVDEVNGPPDYTLHRGSVWRFTTEPVGYPIAHQNIIATSSSTNRADEGPENTINGSGLGDDDLHSSENTAMWLSSIIGPQPTWIQYEFDRVYKLHQMLVWNYNSSVEPIVGFGIKDAAIEYSVDGTNWAVLGTTHEFAQGTGAVGYAPNTTVELGGLAAKYVRITANSNWGGIVKQYGLSEVRFLYIPVWAREPNPDSGTTGVDVDTILSFRAGREAARHDVYLGTDEQAVMEGTTPVTTVTEASYATLLDLAGTYYWRIDEINDVETPTTWQGDIWNLSTQEYLVVDDFESYNDIPSGEEGSNLIYGTWADGFENPANGSTIGYNVPFQPTMETSLVCDGQQSVPLFYDNTVATYSEVTASVADLDIGLDWTKHGIKALTLHFYGDPNNSVNEQMYVKLNGSKVTYDGDAENLRLKGWQMWYIDLASLGMSLSSVTELAIGFERIGAVGGQGMVLLDGIRLYSYDRQLITPADPGAVGLQAHYEFEGNTNDSSGNARNGTIKGSPTFVAGKIGKAINLRGLNDYVEITGYKGVLGQNAVTVTAWIRTSNTDTGAIVGWGPNVAGQRFGFRVDAGRLRIEHQGGNVQADTLVNDGGWHHVAVMVQENATISYPDVILYLDGTDDTRPTTDPDMFNLTAGEDVSIGRRPSNNDRFFLGQIDEVRIYDRMLTQEDISWLAGRTKPFDRPF